MRQLRIVLHGVSLVKKVKVAKGEDWRGANPDVTGISDGELCQRDRVTSWCGPRVTPDHKSGKHQIYKSTQVTQILKPPGAEMCTRDSDLSDIEE